MDRNNEIIKLREEGHSFREIAKIYQISGSRVAQIFHRHEFQERQKKMFESAPEILNLPIRTRNCLLRNGISCRKEYFEFVNSGGDISTLRCVGEKTRKEIEEWAKEGN